MKKKRCEYCNNEFAIKASWPLQRFCSRMCGYSNRRTRVPFYSVESLCGCGCKGVILNPNDHYRWTKYIQGHQNKNGNHPRLGYKEPDEHVEQRLKAMHAHFNTKEPTSIENQLYEYLDSVGIIYEKQKQFGRTVPDAYIPELKLAIYADGLYWHNTPDHIEKDERCNDKCKKLGLEVIRLPSKDNGYNLDLTKLKMFIQC